MQADKQSPTLSYRHEMLDVLTSVVIGDASKEDIIGLMRGEGDQSFKALNKILGRPPDGLERENAAKLDKGIVHRVPKVPILLNATLYDPEDIQRFNGQALHLVQTANKDYLLAIDDADVMMHWWRLARLASLEHYKGGAYYKKGGPKPVGGQPQPGQITPQDHEGGGGVGPVSPHFYLSHVYQHADFQGDKLSTEINRGFEGYSYGPQHYANLLHVSRGFLGGGNWNDIISSVWVEHGTCILHEHIYYGVLDGGSTYTLTSNDNYLADNGWNDRASSVEAF